MSEERGTHPTLEDLAIGRPTIGWMAGMIFFGLLAALGTYAYSVQISRGLISTGMRTIVAWGLYVGFDVYFVGISFAGISVSALARLFGLQALRPLTRIAELLTIVCLLVGGGSILADLGRPLEGLRYLPLYARPASPFFGTFTLVVAGYLFASLVYFYLAGRADASFCAQHAPRWRRWIYATWASGYTGTLAERERHSRVSFWLSLFILPLLVTAHSTLGFVFGIQGGRPGWFSALQAPGFVVLAGASGIGLLVVVAAAIRRCLRLEALIEPEAFRLLGNFVWILTLIYLYFMVVEELTASYAAARADTHVAHEILNGAYAPLFWSTVTCFVVATIIGFSQFAAGRVSIGWSVLAGGLVNVAAVLKRFLIVVPSQTHGMLLPYREVRYVPTWVELGVVAGLIGVAGLLYLLFLKLFPIVPLAAALPDEAAEAGEATPQSNLRRLAFTATLATGAILTTAGFLLSLRFGTLPYLDPIVPFSPVIFILGVMVTFYSAAVYETVPRAAARD